MATHQWTLFEVNIWFAWPYTIRNIAIGSRNIQVYIVAHEWNVLFMYPVLSTCKNHNVWKATGTLIFLSYFIITSWRHVIGIWWMWCCDDPNTIKLHILSTFSPFPQFASVWEFATFAMPTPWYSAVTNVAFATSLGQARFKSLVDVGERIMWIYCQFQTGMNGESTHGSYMVAGRAHWQYCPITGSWTQKTLGGVFIHCWKRASTCLSPTPST